MKKGVSNFNVSRSFSFAENARTKLDISVKMVKIFIKKARNGQKHRFGG